MKEEHVFPDIPPSGQDHGSDRLEESAADVATFIAAGAGIAAAGFGATQAFYARATYRLQRDAAQSEPTVADRDRYDPGFADQEDYDPGFSSQADSVLDLRVDDELSYGPGGQEFFSGFDDLDY